MSVTVLDQLMTIVMLTVASVVVTSTMVAGTVASVPTDTSTSQTVHVSCVIPLFLKLSGK